MKLKFFSFALSLCCLWSDSLKTHSRASSRVVKVIQQREESLPRRKGSFMTTVLTFNIIEINEPVTLVSAKVFANGPGPRTLAILSAEGDPLTFDVFDLPDGESIVEFNWDLGPGSYGFGSLSNNPQLWRDDLNSDINYPYPLGDYGAITGTSIQGDNEFNYYYFFYDVTLAPQGPSVNSGGYPCLNVELLDVAPIAEVGGGANGNDCWGWTDPVSGREIAIYGRSSGTSFIDVTDPTDMKFFADLPTASSLVCGVTSRSMKTTPTSFLRPGAMVCKLLI